MASTGFPVPVRRVTRLGVLVAVVSLVALALAVPAHASPSTPPAGYGTGPNYCSKYPGGKNAGPIYANVYACNGSTTGNTTFDSPGSGTYAWQCVELSARFLWAIHGIWAGPGSEVTTGADLVSVVHKNHPSIAVATPSPSSVPVAGDVISFGPGGGSDPDVGHTAVVITNTASNGKFTIMSENDPDGSAGTQVLTVDKTGGHNGSVLFNGAWTSARWLVLSPPHTTGTGPAPGTSPAITAMPGGGYEIAYQSASGQLYVKSSSGATSGPHGNMAANTSPAITALSGGAFEIAYQGASGRLFDYVSTGATHGPLGNMAANTSPAITALSGGAFEIAYQGASGRLFDYVSTGATHGPLGNMAANTSPAITALSGGAFEIAYQGASARLFDYVSTGATHGPLGNMAANTSPSITALSGGTFEIAYQGASARLFDYVSTGGGRGPLGNMAAGTSPAITALSASAFEIAYQGASHTLWEYSSTGASHGPLGGMSPGTSPAITELSAGSGKVVYQNSSGTLSTY